MRSLRDGALRAGWPGSVLTLQHQRFLSVLLIENALAVDSVQIPVVIAEEVSVGWARNLVAPSFQLVHQCPTKDGSFSGRAIGNA